MCELFQIALCRTSGREWPARDPAVWEEHDAEPVLYRPTVLTERPHQAAAGAPAPQSVVRELALPDTTLEQGVIFVVFHCLSLLLVERASQPSSPAAQCKSFGAGIVAEAKMGGITKRRFK
jgi:hypothetical protein